MFNGYQLARPWRIVEEKIVKKVGKKSYGSIKWEKRTLDNCYSDIKILAKNMLLVIDHRYEKCSHKFFEALCDTFDLEILIKNTIENNNNNSFHLIYDYIKKFPQIQENETYYTECYKNFKACIIEVIQLEKYWTFLFKNTIKKDKKDKEVLLNLGDVINIEVLNDTINDVRTKFILHFHDKSTKICYLEEENLWQILFTDKFVYEKIGKEFMKFLDIIFALSGPEAVVESFYSVMGHHTFSKSDNSSIVLRTKIDWIWPNASQVSDKLLKEVSDKYFLKNKRTLLFSDRRCINKYDVSKVVDRQKNEKLTFEFMN